MINDDILRKPTLRELRAVREQFALLIAARAKETEFQKLFSQCPYVLSESLPLRLRPTEIRPIARPGKSDPDFIIIPRSDRILDSVGVIELKRPSTILITKPRKEIALLSRDVATAVAQGQNYCKRLRSELAPQFSKGLAISSNDYIFIIAGLTDEVTRKLDSYSVFECLRAQMPGSSQLIPYDELLRRFDEAVSPTVFSLAPLLDQSLLDLETILSIASTNESSRRAINDDNMDFWSSLEDRWRAGNYIGTKVPRVIDRLWWCVSGTNQLATESPAHIDFPNYIDHLVQALKSSLNYHLLLYDIQHNSWTIEQLKHVITIEQFRILDKAIARCRSIRYNSTFLDVDSYRNQDVEILKRLGCLRFQTVESADSWYGVDETLLELW